MFFTTVLPLLQCFYTSKSHKGCILSRPELRSLRAIVTQYRHNIHRTSFLSDYNSYREMADKSSRGEAQNVAAVNKDSSNATSLMLESVGSLQVYLSAINVEIAYLKRFKTWAQPILESIDYSSHGQENANCRTPPFGKEENENGVVDSKDTQKLGDVPVKEESVFQVKQVDKQQAPVKRKRTTTDSKKHSQFRMRKVVQESVWGAWQMRRRSGGLVGISPPPL